MLFSPTLDNVSGSVSSTAYDNNQSAVTVDTNLRLSAPFLESGACHAWLLKGNLGRFCNLVVQ